MNLNLAPCGNKKLFSLLTPLAVFAGLALSSHVVAHADPVPVVSADPSLDADISKAFAGDTGYFDRVVLAYRLKGVKEALSEPQIDQLSVVRDEYEAFKLSLEDAIANKNDLERVKDLYVSHKLKYNEKVIISDNDMVTLYTGRRPYPSVKLDSNLQNGLTYTLSMIATQRVNCDDGHGGVVEIPCRNGLAILHFFLDEANIRPTLNDLKIIALGLNNVKYINWEPLLPDSYNVVYIYFQEIAQSLVDSILSEQLKVFAQDPYIKSCSGLKKIIKNKLNVWN